MRQAVGDAPALDVTQGVTLRSQITMMIRAFWASPQRPTLLMLGGGLVLVVGATAYMQVRLNAWNEPFYDALSRKDLGQFLAQLGVFAIIASILLTLVVSQTWLNQMTKLKLREGLARDLFEEWLQPRRAFRLASAGEIGANPDQRIHEDARHLTELSTDLGVGLLQASLLLFSFIGVLWLLSRDVAFHVAGHEFSIPGYMDWAALLYAAAASALSWRVGRRLIGLNAERYAREAELRFALVRVSEHSDAISLQGGEADEKQRLNVELDDVLAVTRRIVFAITGLTWVTSGYGWFTIVAPILVAAPAYFGGELSFGGLMVVVGAFVQVQNALKWFVDNIGPIADWRATLLRVASFRQAVVTMDRLGGSASRIDFAPSRDGRLTFERLEIASPAGAAMLQEAHVEIAAGEHVLIVGETGAGKTLLFRAIAGLWPWGSGRIAFPEGQGVVFMPRNPYVPPGTLRAAVAYPAPPTAYPDADIVAALERLGLGALAPSLERDARWDRDLNDDEQQRIAFARLVLHKPEWVVLDEAFEVLDDASRALVLRLFDEALPQTAVVSVGRPNGDAGFFGRTLHLVKDAEGPRLVPVAPELVA
jgi:putative ATP-binding cassette transporter